jgi:PucR family transcriptional regulator, purine catabolism regulatory protein
VLGELHRHDASRHAELLPTLRAYLENDLQPSRTAAVLFIHVNSLTYRLKRIGALTGVNIRSSDGLLELSFALAIDRLLQR